MTAVGLRPPDPAGPAPLAARGTDPVTVPGTGVALLALPGAAPWREDPGVRAAVAVTVARVLGGSEPSPTTADRVTADMVDRLLTPGRFVVRTGTGHRVGVGASHEAGRTYVAVAPDAVVVDACALDRWGEVAAAGADAFTPAERAAMRTPWDWVRAWTALECAAKAGHADLLRPRERAPLVVAGLGGRAVVDGDGVGLHLVRDGGRLRAVCVRVAVVPGATTVPVARELVGVPR